jgi:hypothetical protein
MLEMKGWCSVRRTFKGRRHRLLATMGIAIFTLVGMIVPNLAPVSPAYGATITNTAFQLRIIPIAEKFPADEGTYHVNIQLQSVKDSNPVFAPYDIDIRIGSSDPSVLTIEEKVTLREGQSMVKAELMTTLKAGEATITAQSEGIRSANIAINTLKLDSLEPTKIALSSAPSSLVPDPNINGIVYVQLLNSQNLPAAAKQNVLVNLSSSKPEVGTVPSYVTISQGLTGMSVFLTPKGVVGTTKISASAPGLAPAQLDVKTDGQIATKLAIDFAPPKIPSAKGFKSMMSVQLRDASDNPVNAIEPVEITLRSSNTSVTRVPYTITVKPGESYVMVPLLSEGGSGKAEITASVKGLDSGTGVLETTTISSGASEYFIKLYQVPSKLPANNAGHMSVIIQFVDSADRPYNAFSFAYERVIISSSDPRIGAVLYPYEQQYLFAIATFKTTAITGSTTITASSDGFTSAQKDIQVSGATPASLKLTQIPPVVQANNIKSQPLVMASLLDSTGKPTYARENKIVYLSSSNPEVASPLGSIMIRAGTSHSFVDVDTTTTPGDAMISATASELATGNLKLQVAGSKGTISHYGFALTTVPKILANGQEYDAIFIQLQDLTGNNPVPASSDITIFLSSSSPSAGRVQSEVTIPKGSSYAVAKFLTRNVEESGIKITASSPGFKSVEATLQTTLQPVEVTFVSRPPTQADFDVEIPVEVQAKASSFPLKGATIEVSGQYADPTYTTTDESGYAKGIYIPNRPGTNSIEAKVIMPGYKEGAAKSGISLSQSLDLVIKATSESGRDIPAQLKVQALKTAAKTYNTQAVLKNAKWGPYTVTALDTKNTSGEFKFVSWSDGETQNPRTFDVIRDDTLTAVYSAKYLLQVSSEFGNTWGAGYYNEGDRPVIGIDTAYVSAGLIDKNFAGWSGDILSESSTSQVTMNGPKVVKAEWQDNYLKVIILAGGSGGAGFYLYTKMIKPRKVKEKMTRMPDLDWYNS